MLLPPLAFLTLAAHVVLIGGSADEFSPQLCIREPIPCECQDGLPFVVSCSNFDLEEVPLAEDQSYTLSWALFLEGNRLTNITVIPQQDMLVELSLSHNSIRHISEGAFTKLPELRSLNLSHNLLTKDSLTKDVFLGPDNQGILHNTIGLEVLDLSHNGIDTLIPHAFNHLSKLKALAMTDNGIYDFTKNTQKAFEELVALETLDLSRNQLVRIPDHFFASMRNLQKLYLGGNAFTTVPQDINFIRTLTYVNLDHNPIKLVNTEARFHTSTSLTEISLSHIPTLVLVDRGAFSLLPNLRVLSMHHNPSLKYISNGAFNSSDYETSMREIYLQSNNLSTLYEDLLPWHQMTVVNLQDNPWHCDCRLEWFVKGPLQNTSFTDITLTDDIYCRYPDDLYDININVLIAEQYEFECVEYHRRKAHAGLVGFIIFLGIMLLVSSATLFAYIVYKKIKSDDSFGQTVHYRRTKDIDFETIS